MSRQQDIEYIRSHHLTTSIKAMARYVKRSPQYVLILKKEAGIYTPEHIRQAFKRSTQITKGTTAWNKGVKLSDYMSAENIAICSQTSFKKGHEPANTKYDGAISIRCEKNKIPYYFIRISKAIWKPLHRHIWEQHHGPIPQGTNIQFKDGNTLNCSIDNLFAIPRIYSAQINRYGGRSVIPELVETIILINNLKKTIHEKQNN